MDKDLKYKRTKKGLITRMYALQKSHSKKRSHIKPNYSKNDLKDWLYSQPLFHILYQIWKNNDYSKNLIPSCDRLKDDLPYTLDNIQLSTWVENKLKAEQHMRDGKLSNYRTPHKAVIQKRKGGSFIQYFVSAHEAQRQLGINQGNISKVCNGKQKTAGGFIWEFIPKGMRYSKEFDKLVPDVVESPVNDGFEWGGTIQEEDDSKAFTNFSENAGQTHISYCSCKFDNIEDYILHNPISCGSHQKSKTSFLNKHKLNKFYAAYTCKITENKYDRVIFDKKGGSSVVVDVYSVLKAFEVKCPALQHLIKKALCAGLRGHKDIETDLQDIIDSANRAKELHMEKKDGK